MEVKANNSKDVVFKNVGKLNLLIDLVGEVRVLVVKTINNKEVGPNDGIHTKVMDIVTDIVCNLQTERSLEQLLLVTILVKSAIIVAGIKSYENLRLAVQNKVIVLEAHFCVDEMV
ncbi:hypothetical protein DGG96_09395 [Legionella qingyii]|uniref:Uncharacterized protein n=1 Tax=Legionella qingyii TaxID=2184757 RepID=A0A317U3K2_9GAMM|nr:hypothetical protein [Legionella qingyii]PWY55939.1 hypothetical protein DGG96_09395 [Legionella qingyii]